MTPPRSASPAATVRAGWRRRSSRPPTVVIGAVSALAVVFAVMVLTAGDRAPSAAPPLDAPRAAVLGAVEGITEFLPVSSTGHLVVAGRVLGLGKDEVGVDIVDSYSVIIQGGAILAVARVFRRRLLGVARAALGMLRAPGGRRDVASGYHRLTVAILVAAAPAALIGLVAGEWVKRHLFSPSAIAVAWAAGGLALIAAAGWLRRRGESGPQGGVDLDQITGRHAFLIGMAQAVALWPGVSRSLVTIVAGCLAGLTLPAAVELSFLVGFVVLLGASGFEAVRQGDLIVSAYGWVAPLLGIVVAFACAAAAIRWLLRIVSHRSLVGFGWYRVTAGVLTFGLLTAGLL